MLSSASEHRGWKREAPRSATNPEAPKVQWPPVAADGRERDLERSSSATIFHRPKLMSTTLTCAEASDGQRGVRFAAANRREISQSRRLPSGLALRSSHDDYLPLTYHRTRGAPLLERAKAPGTGPTPREPPRPGAHAGPLVGRGYPGTPGAPLCGEHSPPRDRLRGDGPPPLGAARCAPSTSQISTGLVLLARARRPLCDPGARRAPDGGVRQRPGATPARRRALRALRHPTPRGKGARQTPRPDHECGWNHRVPRPHGSLPGGSKLRRALARARERSGSPRESKTVHRLEFSPRLGGYGLEVVGLNDPVLVERAGAALGEAQERIRKPDIMLLAPADAPLGSIPFRGCALDYQGEYHRDEAQKEKDTNRRNELLACGIKPYEIEKDHYDDPGYLDWLVSRIRRDLGIEEPSLGERAREARRARRERLRLELDRADGLTWTGRAEPLLMEGSRALARGTES